MKIIYQYTLRALRKNKTRTIVTIIGIILSVALLTAVTEGAYSGQQFYLKVVEQDSGRYHAYFRDLTQEQLTQLQHDSEVDEFVSTDMVGYAKVDSADTRWSYLYIAAADAHINDMLPIHILDGRMPTNDTELLLPDHLEGFGGIKLETGEQVTLQVGQRVLSGDVLGQGSSYKVGESLQDVETRTYTVVGHYEKLAYVTEGNAAPGYLSFTGGSGCGSYTAYVRLHSVRDVDAFCSAGTYGDDYAKNTDLMFAYGETSNGYFGRTLYGLVAILLVLIVGGSILLIYNAFSISVSDRTRHFGLLKSIGATKKQVRQSVLMEGILLCLIGIPFGLLLGCAGIGTTLYLLKDEFASFLAGAIAENVDMKFVLGAWPIIAAAAVGLLTVLISAWIPARRAAKVTPIDAIRSTNDVKIPNRSVKTSKLTLKVFGLEGTLAKKNFKRSKKSYRATVVSLAMSIVLFVSVSSFEAHLTNTVGAVLDNNQADIVCNFYHNGTITQQDVETLYQKMAVVDGLKESGYEFYWGGETERIEQGDTKSISISFLPDNAFRQLLEQNNISEDAYFQSPVGILKNEITMVEYEDNGDYRYISSQPFPKDIKSLNVSCYVLASDDTPDDDIAMNEMEIDAETGETLERTDYTTVSLHLNIGATIQKAPRYSYIGSESLCVYYPASMTQAVMGDIGIENGQIYFYADNHKAVMDELVPILNENGAGMSAYLNDIAAENEAQRGLITVLNVFSMGLIVMISLIAAVNVFNTVSTNISLRRREFAMLQSIGMTPHGLHKMLNFECLVYGVRALLYGVPISLVFAYLIYHVLQFSYSSRFIFPWSSLAVSAASVFVVVFASMLYARKKLDKQSTVETLKNENV